MHFNGSNLGVVVEEGLLIPLDWAVELRSSSPRTKALRRRTRQKQNAAPAEGTARLLQAAENAPERAITGLATTPAEKMSAAHILSTVDVNTCRCETEQRSPTGRSAQQHLMF